MRAPCETFLSTLGTSVTAVSVESVEGASGFEVELAS